MRKSVLEEDQQQPIQLQKTQNLLRSVKEFILKDVAEKWDRMRGVSTDGGERSLANEVSTSWSTCENPLHEFQQKHT